MGDLKSYQGIRVTYPEPHLERAKKILQAHPDVRKLFGNTPKSAFFVFGIVALQVAVAYFLKDSSIGWILLAAYTVGAVCDHALWVLIHECTHNLVFKGSRANSWLQIFANLPIIFPSAMSFRIYHLKHHRFQGDLDQDADLPRPFEDRLIGNSSLGKALWMLFFFASQLVRVPFLKGIPMVTRWVVANWAAEIAFVAAVAYFWGGHAFAYLMLSSIFAIGLHPLGARWIQEHYVVHENQETYSYYGPLNKVAFNVGYHNEHHDLMMVSWSNLPKLRAMAPEFYDNLYWHRSWTGLILRFIFDPKLRLSSRVIRMSKASLGEHAPASMATPSAPDPAVV